MDAEIKTYLHSINIIWAFLYFNNIGTGKKNFFLTVHLHLMEWGGR